MTTVSQAQMVSGDIVLSSPDTQTPPVTASQADLAAEQFMDPGTQWTLRENVLADYTGGDPPGTVNRLVWVVSMLPPGGTSSLPSFEGAHSAPGPRPDPAASQQPSSSSSEYLIVLVDANSGQAIFAQQGN
jgi:hypothetical protein